MICDRFAPLLCAVVRAYKKLQETSGVPPNSKRSLRTLGCSLLLLEVKLWKVSDWQHLGR